MDTPVFNAQESDTSGGLSKLDVGFLPVGASFRQPLGHYEAPCDVQSATDLPSCFYLGSLVVESFRATGLGWSVRYEDADPETYVSLEYTAPRGPLIARFVWAGIEGMSTFTSGVDWKGLVQHMSLGFPETWEQKAKEGIEATFNARLLVRSKNAPVIIGFPDGAFQTLVFPVPSYRLHELVPCLDELHADSEIAGVVAAYVAMTQARVDYVQGRCPDVPNTPEALAAHSRRAIGLACHGLPELETVDDGLRILVLNRWVYLVHVTCVFRDLMRVMSLFHRHGFIGGSEEACAASDYPDGAEWATLILPGGYEAQDARIQYFDRGPSRRVAYGRLLPPERLLSVAAVRDISRKEATRCLVVAQAWALSQPDIVWPDVLQRTH